MQAWMNIVMEVRKEDNTSIDTLEKNDLLVCFFYC